MSGEGGNTAELRTATWLWLPERKSSVIRALPSVVMPSGTKASPRFLRLPEVRDMTGVSTNTIYRWMTEGTFPKQIQLGCHQSWSKVQLFAFISKKRVVDLNYFPYGYCLSYSL